MKELSLHILDIVQNSIKAKATMIKVTFYENVKENIIKIVIEDNGCGMENDVLKNVLNPFYTTRKTRKVGLGLSLLNEACERCNGFLKIDSEINKGTKVECQFERDNIDRAPLGDMSQTIISIIISLENDCEFLYEHILGDSKFEFSTIKIKEILEGVDIKEPNVLNWLKEYLSESMNNLN